MTTPCTEVMGDMAAHSTDAVDDFYFSALSTAGEDLYPISDEKCADELQLQEVLIGSASIATPPNHRRDALAPSPPSTLPVLLLPAAAGTALPSARETRGTSSLAPFDTTGAAVGNGKGKGKTISSLILCKICMDTAPSEEMFRTSSCSHSFCRDCTRRHIGAKVRENIHVVRCPEINCMEAVKPELCQGLIPAEVFERWQTALCEALFLGFRRTYCPFKDCSALFIDDDEAEVTQAVCPSCNRLFCAACQVSWHTGVTCGEFQKLRPGERQRDDLLLLETAKNNNWKRCPRCRFYVEKTQGCLHITCRCAYEFCYGCGLTWSSTHRC